MSNYLKELRAKSKQSIETLSKQIDDSKKSSYVDDRVWKLSVDSAGNGDAVIRFLPPIEGSVLRWVEKYSHGFSGVSGKWYMENCPTTIKGECPVCDANRIIWNNNIKEVAQKKTEKTKRSHKYFSNILVVDDPANPINNGKVFLYEYGPKIFAKIEEAIKPISARQKAIDPFDIDEGANFLLLAKNVSGQRNYDSSKFESQSPISDDDVELEKILTSIYSLESLVSPENFKSFSELNNLLNRVNGNSTINYEVEPEEEEEEFEDPTPPVKKKKDVVEDLDLDDLPF